MAGHGNNASLPPWKVLADYFKRAVFYYKSTVFSIGVDD
jgi:hypothetical protein